MKRFVFIIIILFAVSSVVYASGVETSRAGGGYQMPDADYSGFFHASDKKQNEAVKDYVKMRFKKTKTFNIYDKDIETHRILKLTKVHKKILKSEDFYIARAVFRDTKTKEIVELDVDVASVDDRLKIDDVYIYKVNGKPKFRYDDSNNRVELKY